MRAHGDVYSCFLLVVALTHVCLFLVACVRRCLIFGAGVCTYMQVPAIGDRLAHFPESEEQKRIAADKAAVRRVSGIILTCAH